jgi:hypothetical protein
MASGTLEAELAELHQRVQRLEDERAIMGVFSRYSHAMDYGLLDLYREVFAEDGTFDSRRAGGDRIHIETGTDELIAYVAERAADRAATVDKHLLAQPMVVELTDTEARVESFWVALHDKGAGPVIYAYGRYNDHLVKVDGRWRIKERRSELEAPLSGR